MIYRKALVGKRAKSGEGGGIADRSDRAGPGAGTEKLYFFFHFGRRIDKPREMKPRNGDVACAPALARIALAPRQCAWSCS